MSGGEAESTGGGPSELGAWPLSVGESQGSQGECADASPPPLRGSASAEGSSIGDAARGSASSAPQELSAPASPGVAEPQADGARRSRRFPTRAELMAAVESFNEVCYDAIRDMEGQNVSEESVAYLRWLRWCVDTASRRLLKEKELRVRRKRLYELLSAARRLASMGDGDAARAAHEISNYLAAVEEYLEERRLERFCEEIMREMQ